MAVDAGAGGKLNLELGLRVVWEWARRPVRVVRRRAEEDAKRE